MENSDQGTIMALDLLRLTVAELRQKARDVGLAELLEEAACAEDQRAS